MEPRAAEEIEGDSLPDEVLKHINRQMGSEGQGGRMNTNLKHSKNVLPTAQRQNPHPKPSEGGSPEATALHLFEEQHFVDKSNKLKENNTKVAVGSVPPSYGDYYLEHPHQEDQKKDTIPSPTPLRAQRNLSTLSRPGAYRGGGSFDLEGGIWSEPSAETDDQDSGLDVPIAIDSPPIPVANVVDNEEKRNQGLPQAESVDLDLRTKARRTERNLRKKFMVWLLAAVVLVVIGAIVVAFKLRDKDHAVDPSSSPTLLPSSSPSYAPTSFEDYAWSMLPSYTLQAIQEDPQDSPQAKAFEWLLEDVDYNPLLEDQRVLQRFSLATFYFATGGEQWVSTDNWLNHTAHECNWYQVQPTNSRFRLIPTCDANGMLQQLGLTRNNMKNTLPLELFLLTSLRTLSLGFNTNLQGPIPTHIGQLSKLIGLSIHSLRNGGEIPTQVGLLPHLETLSLANNKHVGKLPSELGMLSNLMHFSMGQNPQLQGCIAPITSMSKLKRFSSDRNDHTGTIPTEIGQLADLEWFLVGGNQLSGSLPSQFFLLTNMVLASFYRNQLIGTIPTELGLLTASSLLAFNGNNLEGTIPSELGHLTNLTLSFNFEGNPLMRGTIPTELGALTNLYDLSFANNNHTGPIPSQLGMLTLLGRLDLGNNSLTGTIPPTLSSLHQSLYSFDVHDNALLSGTMPEALCALNGTCTPHQFRLTCPEGTHVAFHCTDLLKGCNCSSGNTTNGTKP